MFNNGYHTAHHNKASVHWSQLPAAHKKLAHLIAPHLNLPTILGYLFKTYLLEPLRILPVSKSMRIQRQHQKEKVGAKDANLVVQS
jgi:fatty acid desaturase